jgi:hypothetical protein
MDPGSRPRSLPRSDGGLFAFWEQHYREREGNRAKVRVIKEAAVKAWAEQRAMKPRVLTMEGASALLSCGSAVELVEVL